MMLECDVTPERGLIRISGIVPDGGLIVQRTAEGHIPFTLRGGIQTIVLEGFSLEDSEAPLGVPVTYTAISTPAVRTVQRNLVLSPDFGHGLTSWTTGVNRVLTLAGGFGHVTNNPSGAGAGATGRTIGEVAVSPLVPGSRYLVTGRVRFKTPDVWTWQDVKAFGTWSAVKAAKASWEAVRSTQAGTGPVNTFNTLYVSLSNGTTDYVAPFAVLNVPMAQAGQWITFSAFVTAPAGIASTARLRLLHGTTTREFAVSWDLDQFSVFTEADAAKPYRLFWFNGDTTVPSRPQDYLIQGPDWEDVSGDSSIFWEGTPGNSVSRFNGPSQVSTSTICQIDPPSVGVPCDPILLSDPVASALSQWFGLAPIEPLSYDARMSMFDVLDRPDRVGRSSKRSSASGSLTLFTDTLEQRKSALSVFASGRVLLLRIPSPDYPENGWYIMCGNVEEVRALPKSALPNRIWTVPFVQVQRPKGLIEASTGTRWSDIKDAGLTWAQLRTRGTWLDVILDEP